jgi:predicted acylesterase/phospholipase RssA
MPAPINPELWKSLTERYSESRPRRMLSLDGGGIRGILTLQVLLKIETELAAHYYPQDPEKRQNFRLCQFFDYIGGTSTGAIIAAALAIGMSVQETINFYESFGKVAFSKHSLRESWKIIYSLYENGPLQQKLQQVYGNDRDLSPDNLKTLLLVVTRNSTTDSAWPIGSNPAAKYNKPDRPDCNLKIPLWKIVRASTAAPVFFPPEVVQWDTNDESKAFLFVDGGTTAYNNPAFLLWRMATEPAYKLEWEKGEQNLLIVSVGTGTTPALGNSAAAPETNLIAAAGNTLSALMHQVQVDQDMNCRTVGRCTYGAELDLEVGDLVPRDDAGNKIPLAQNLGRNFLYARYDLELTDKGLKNIDSQERLLDIDPKPLQKLDAVDSIDELIRVGQVLGEKVDLSHFGDFIEQPLA